MVARSPTGEQLDEQPAKPYGHGGGSQRTPPLPRPIHVSMLHVASALGTQHVPRVDRDHILCDLWSLTRPAGRCHRSLHPCSL